MKNSRQRLSRKTSPSLRHELNVSALNATSMPDRNSILSIRAALTAMLLACLAAPALAEDNLYRAQTIVTGTGEANRLIGFAACLEDVLIKVSGQLRLAGDPRLAPYKEDAARRVRDYSYRDEKGGKPKNDEQGTRDRSFVLTVDFDEAAINAVLAALGTRPWLSRRPAVAVFAEFQLSARRYVVASDAKPTDLEKQALQAAAFKRGVSSCCRMPRRCRTSASMTRCLPAFRRRSLWPPQRSRPARSY